jgi:hypothetical protein
MTSCGGQGELYDPTGRHVELVNLTIAFRVLNLPHPLFANHVDLHSAGGRTLDAEVLFGTPNVKTNHHEGGNQGPGDLDSILGQAHRAAVDHLALPVFYQKVYDGAATINRTTRLRAIRPQYK